MRVADRFGGVPSFVRAHARGLLIVAGGAVLALVVSSGAGSAVSEKTVETKGKLSFQENVFVRSSQRFSPGRITIESGGTVTFLHNDDTPDPHTVTISLEENLPDTPDEALSCEPCPQVGDAHFPADGPPAAVVEAGAPGLDSPGDSLLFFEDEEISATVSAPSGTTLYYVCIIHGWMQGEIRVRGEVEPGDLD